MSPYNFRIRFLLEEGRRFKHEKSNITFSSSGNSFELSFRTHDPKSIGDSKEFILCGGPFVTEQDAESFGKKVKNALMLTAARLKMGFDLGKDKATGGFTRVVKDRVREKTDILLLDDVHGLCVYDASVPNIKFTSITATITVSSSVSRFIEAFKESNNQRLDLNEKELLAFELYSASNFESSERARFLTLVMVIEALLQPKPKSDTARKLVESFKKMTKDSKLEATECESLLGGLKWLRDESISKTGKDLVEKHLKNRSYFKKKAKDFFAHCYDLRSQLIHKGCVKDVKTDVGKIVVELDKMVADLLTRIVSVNVVESEL